MLDVDYRVEKTEKFNLKNGCCRECMKAFSKNKKVSNGYERIIYLRVAYAKCQDFRGGPLFL